MINVNAILPGARPPATLRRMSMETTGAAKAGIESPERETHSTPIAASAPHLVAAVTTPVTVDQNTSGGSAAVLSSLNKSRAKVMVKRRPSTRQGRRESLRKSQQFEVEKEEDKDVIVEDAAKEVMKEQVVEVRVEKEKPQEEEEEKKKEKKKTRKLFESDDEDEDSDELFKPKVAAIVTQVKKTTTKTSLFSDDDSEEDLFAGASSLKGGTCKSKQPLNLNLILLNFPPLQPL